MATYPVYDEHGDLVGHYRWKEIPVLFRDNWYLERGVFHLGRPKDAAPPVSAHEQVRLIDPEGALCGYYSAEQVRAMSEPVTRSGDTASLLSRPTPFRRLHLLRDSYYNPGITPERRSEVTSLIISLAAEERGRLDDAQRSSERRATEKRASPRGKASTDAPKKPSQDGTEGRPKARGRNERTWSSRCVVRDENGCFLGVHTLDEACAIWPSARSSGALILVPGTVPFDAAQESVEASRSWDIAFAQRRYNDSVAAAREFASAHVGQPAEEYWRMAIDRPVNVVDNLNEPIGMVTPRMLDKALGTGWFMVSDDLAQLLNTWSVGRSAKALRPYLEDTNLSDDDVPSGMRHIRDERNNIVLTCDEEAFDRIYKNLLRKMPAGSYAVGLAGVRLRRGFEELGFSSRDEFADACTSAAASVTEPSPSKRSSRKPRGFEVRARDGKVLYKCGSRRAKQVSPHILAKLPKRSYEHTADGIRLLVDVSELGFDSPHEFMQWCGTCDRGQTAAVSAVKKNRNRDSRPARQAAGTPSALASFIGPENVLHICKGTIACRRRGHKVESATGTIVTLGGRELRINTNWCGECGMYFLGYGEYAHYRETYGPILGNFKFEGAGNQAGDGFGALADESPLMLCGYSVSEAEGLTEGQRHLILANIMDRGICPKHRVIEYLQFFIRSRRNLPSMRSARAKWQADLDWVRDYRINTQRRFTVAEVRRFR